MTLLDLLSVTSENTNVFIHQDDTIVSSYDGKNSIDEIYNNQKVITQWTDKDGLHIEIVL